MMARFVDWDLELYDEATDTPATANTSNLLEELGQACVCSPFVSALTGGLGIVCAE
jgi:hypothetical protein